MKIVVLDGYCENPGDLSWDCLNRFGDVTVYDRTPAELIIPRIGDAEIILLNKTPITDKTLAACPSVKLICVLATGYNVVDCDAAKKRGIPVCNVPAYGTAAVAQFTFSLLLMIFHKSLRILSASSTPMISKRLDLSCSSMCSTTPSRIVPP